MNHLNMNKQKNIITLRHQGWTKRRIERELDLDRATVRQYLAEAGSKSPTPQAGSAESPPAKSSTNPQTGSSSGSGPASQCEPLRERIEQALAQGLLIQRIYQFCRQLFCGAPVRGAADRQAGTAFPPVGG